MINDKPLISVIVPCFNQGEFLTETLNSVMGQTYSNWECIIVDDGSEDDTSVVAAEFVEKDRRFSYIKQDNQGPSIARNNGISLSKGTFILPLDSDDIIESTYLEKAIDYFNNHPDTKLIYCRADRFGEELGEWRLPRYSYDALIRSNCLIVSSVFLRKDFDRVGGYNPQMDIGLEDWELWLELLRPNDKVHRIDEILFHYRVRNGSRTTGAYLDRKLLQAKMRATQSPEYQFAIQRFMFRKSIVTWPFKVFSRKNKHEYQLYYGPTWKSFRTSDVKCCLTYPYLVIYRRINRWLRSKT